jgi:glycosyltransferase involved in cell wall biosynthesis
MNTPRLSFGLPVYNGAASIGRTIRSILEQSFEDLELVISDNCSTDATAAIVHEHARGDSRVRFHARDFNAGIVANFNRAFALSRGEYFRWIGADDWVEPSYAEKCVRELDRHPEAIGVTTYQAHWNDRSQKRYLEHQGPRVDSPRAHERFDVCLWLLNEDYRRFDPIYSLHRRRALEHTRGLRPIFNGDQLLAAELSLLGPYAHIPECLANRGIPRANELRVLELLRPPGHPPLTRQPEQYWKLFHELIQAAPLDTRERLACYGSVLRYYLDKFEWVRIRPLRAVVGERLRQIGVPMDRLFPKIEDL